MSSRSNLALAMANMEAFKLKMGIPTASNPNPIGMPPLAPPVPTAPTTPSGEKEAETSEGGKSNTMLYVGIGVGVVILIVVAYFILRKK